MELFEPDSVLAPQFFATLRRQAPSKKGESQLVIAVLEDAVYCFQKYLSAKDPKGQRLFREASEWMMNPPLPTRLVAGNESPSLSFEYICEVLGLDPDYLRRGLRSWRDKQVTSGPAHILARTSAPLQTAPGPVGFDVAVATSAAHHAAAAT
jgi:hypothetical protein